VSEQHVKPFLSFSPRPQSGFADALSNVDVPVHPSPWSPKSNGATVAAPAAAPIDVNAVIAAATERGREEGLAETADLRARLASLVEKLAAAEATTPVKLAELAADAACAVVGAWSQTNRKDVFETVLRAWAIGTPTARVNPADAELITGIPVKPDASIKPGDIVLAGTSAELVHRWDDRLAELRETIVAALEETR
jgi:flagellar biosynthesis/type III secretory pathway protein FliH